jgi:hypothetical protein
LLISLGVPFGGVKSDMVCYYWVMMCHEICMHQESCEWIKK